MSDATETAPEAQAKPTYPPRPFWTRDHIAIMVGMQERPPAPKDPVTGEPKPRGVRLEDLLAFLGIRGGAIGLAAAAFVHWTASNNKASDAMQQLAEVGRAQVQESRESRLVLLGMKNEIADLGTTTKAEQGATREEIGKLAATLGVKQSGPTFAAPPAPQLQGFAPRGRR